MVSRGSVYSNAAVLSPHGWFRNKAETGPDSVIDLSLLWWIMEFTLWPTGWIHRHENSFCFFFFCVKLRIWVLCTYDIPSNVSRANVNWLERGISFMKCLTVFFGGGEFRLRNCTIFLFRNCYIMKQSCQYEYCKYRSFYQKGVTNLFGLIIENKVKFNYLLYQWCYELKNTMVFVSERVR